ncbi:MAG: ABC transporter permease [Alphaproteobacteria bacterium]|nr:ABC transporter permease [Alphaproteobacteria bacterium]
MHGVLVIARRELVAYFSTPVAYVFIVIFLALASATTFYLGGFIERNQADLEPFFSFHPWLHLFFMPAIAMRLWAEERKTGTLEFLMTLPLSVMQAVVGKFLAAWGFAGIALGLTFPMWITVNYLGDPDNGVILAGYLGSWLMAGAFLAIVAALSALTRNQVVAYILGAAVCFVFLTSGLNIVLGAFQGWAPEGVVETIASLSVLGHFTAVTKGVIGARDVVFFASLIGLALLVNAAIVDLRRA